MIFVHNQIVNSFFFASGSEYEIYIVPITTRASATINLLLLYFLFAFTIWVYGRNIQWLVV